MTSIAYRTADVNGLKVFYRESGACRPGGMWHWREARLRRPRPRRLASRRRAPRPVGTARKPLVAALRSRLNRRGRP